jgi:hypothetical protein
MQEKYNKIRKRPDAVCVMEWRKGGGRVKEEKEEL